MSPSRRQLLGLIAATPISCASAPLGPAPQRGKTPRRALAFDAFVIFDPRGFFAQLQRTFGQDGAAAARAFRGRLFDYGWLRVLSGRYKDFWALSHDALDATAREFQFKLDQAERSRLLDRWANLPPWPDAVRALPLLHAQGLQLAVLSNWSPPMLRQAIARSELPLIDLSTHRQRTYKPAPAAYAIGTRHFALPRQSIGFVAFAAWDAAGAAWFGYPTLWMNRAQASLESLELGDMPQATSFDDESFRDFLRELIRQPPGAR